MTDDPRAKKPATSFVRADLEAFAASLPPDDGTDAADVARGFIATRIAPIIETSQPNPSLPISWDLSNQTSSTGHAPTPSTRHCGARPASMPSTASMR